MKKLLHGSLILVVVGFVASSSIYLSGQTVQHNPGIREPVQFDVSPPVAQFPPVVEQPGIPPFVHPAHPIPRLQREYVVDPVVQSAAPTSTIPATSNNFAGVGQGFTGPAGTFSVPGAPSDANLTVGPNHIVQGVNTSYAVFSKTGTVLAGPTKFATLFSNLSGCQNTYYSDPILQYDREADRWVLSILAYASASSGPYYHCIAVSTTGDPTGSYARYAYSFSNLPDYPKMSIWPDAYYVTYNMINGSTFLGAQVCAYARSAMLNGQVASSQCFMTSSSDGGLLPADLDGATAPPAQAPNYLLSLGSNGNILSLWTYHVDWTTPANSTFTGPINVTNAQPFNEACTNGGTCIPQAGTSTQLDSLGDRVMYRLGYRNFADHESLVTNHSVNAGSETGVRWYEVRSPGSNPTVYQQGTYAPDTNHRWMGSVAMDQSGDIAVGFSESSSSVHPEIHYAGRLASDTLGLITQGEASIIDGGGSQTTYLCFPFTCPLTRWGDYTAMRLDPSDDCTFWYTNQYIPSNGSFNWSTRVASFKFPSCGSSLTPTTTALSASPASPSTYGTSVQFSATVTPSGGSGTPTGTATFLDGATTLGTGTLNSSGVATFTTSNLSGGTHSITAAYGGDTSFSGSTSPALPYTVNKATTTTGLTSSASSSTYGQSVTLTATVSPSAATGTLTFFDGANSLGTATLSGGTASLSTSTLAASSTPHSITATYNGNTNHATSTSNIVSVTIAKAATSTTVSSSSPTSTFGQSVTFTATVTSSTSGTPTGTVTFLDGTATLGTGTLSGGKAMFSTSSLSTGSHSITASYGGDSNFIGSLSSAITQTVNAATGDFSISASPGSVSLRQGGTASYTVTISPSGGFTGTVTLSATVQPSGPQPQFSTNPIIGGSGTSTMTVPTSSVARGTYTITITGTSGGLTHSTTVTLKVR